MWFYYQILHTVQSNSLALTIYHYTQYSVSACYKLVISSQFSISCSDQYTCFCACLVMFYFSCTLSYMLSTFQALTHTCATSSRDVGSSSKQPDHAYIDFPISSSVDSVVSPHSPRTTVMNIILVFSHLVSFFARFSWGLSQYFQSSLEAYFRHSQSQLSIDLIFSLY